MSQLKNVSPNRQPLRTRAQTLARTRQNVPSTRTLALKHQAQSSLLDAVAFGVEQGADGNGCPDPGAEQLNLDAGSGDC
jgi:hypothetical protein